jgi:hypothetical protein
MAREWAQHLKGEVIKLYSAGIIALRLNPHTVAVKNKQATFSIILLMMFDL